MKKIFYTIAVAALFAACNQQQETTPAAKTEAPAKEAASLKIAYVIIDPRLKSQITGKKASKRQFKKMLKEQGVIV